MHYLKPIVLVLVTVGGVLFAPADAFAHRMTIEAKVEAEVKVVVGFDDLTAADGAVVKIQNEAKVVVAEARTNENGVCTLARPKPGTYLLIAEDDSGHRETLPLVIPGGPEQVVEAASPPVNRWAMGAVGVGVILLAAFAARKVLARPPLPERKPS